MKLGLSTIGRSLAPDDLRGLGARVEAAGYDSLWTAEAWGADAFTPLAFLAATTTRLELGTAIAQIWARTPGATAMTALTLQQLSGGRLHLGLGVSGPQVVEGWHGGMGSRDRNFYKSLVERYGYEEDAARIQDLFLSGDRKGATAAVPDELVDDLALVGPPAHVAEQLATWRDGPVTTLIVEPTRVDAIEQVADVWASL